MDKKLQSSDLKKVLGSISKRQSFLAGVPPALRGLPAAAMWSADVLERIYGWKLMETFLPSAAVSAIELVESTAGSHLTLLPSYLSTARLRSAHCMFGRRYWPQEDFAHKKNEVGTFGFCNPARQMYYIGPRSQYLDITLSYRNRVEFCTHLL